MATAWCSSPRDSLTPIAWSRPNPHNSPIPGHRVALTDPAIPSGGLRVLSVSQGAWVGGKVGGRLCHCPQETQGGKGSMAPAHGFGGIWV